MSGRVQSLKRTAGRWPASRASSAHALALFCVALLAACSPAAENSVTAPDSGLDVGVAADMPAGPVIDHEQWTAVAAADDPFDDRPDPVDCARGVGWDIEPFDETLTVGVDTIDCNYLGLTQPSLRAIEPGETLAVQLWHFELQGDGPAHVAVAVDGAVVWETTVEIPRDSELIYEEFEVPAGADAGAPVVFHLHNHGLNSWNLVGIRAPD